MDEIFTTKNVLSMLVTAGVGKCIDDMIDATAPANVQLPAKILRKIGTWSLSWVVGDVVSDKAVELVDNTKQAFLKAKEEVDAQMDQEKETNETDISAKEVEE